MAEEESGTHERLVASGRVIRLHFWCRAELPIGSVLRVTGSSLWAPSSLTTPEDPMNAHHIAQERTAESFPTLDDETSAATTTAAAATTGSFGMSEHFPLYTSSVEMVTTPDTYPLWKTKTPVVVVLHKTKKQIQHHYYRYLVVTPGASLEEEYQLQQQQQLQLQQQLQQYELDEHTQDTRTTVATATTASEFASSSTPVMMWEDPFSSSKQSNSNNNGPSGASSVDGLQRDVSTPSLASRVVGLDGTGTIENELTRLANLPYRTLDIHVETARCLQDGMDNDDDIGMKQNDDDDDDELNPPQNRVDTWSHKEDDSFRSYLIRESMKAERQDAKKSRPATLTKQLSEMSTDSFVADAAAASSAMEDDEEYIDTNNNVDGSVQKQQQQQQQQQQSHDKASPTTIFFICFHLPVVVLKSSITGKWKATWSESLLAQKEGSRIVRRNSVHWIGTITTNPPISNPTDQEQVRALLAEMGCTPIFLPQDLIHAHYDGFCKQVLWPAFHNIDLLDLSASTIVAKGSASPDKDSANTESKFGDWDQSRLDDWWNAYQSVNQQFADMVQQCLMDTVGRTINHRDKECYLWIHDYHLSLLPCLLQKAEPGRSCRKVFYLHIPFPTSQIFRELECGESILQGMLHADVVGFHAFDHARHFLNAAKRILGLNYESLVGGLIGVNFRGRTVLVSMSNVSIESKITDVALALPSVATLNKSIEEKHKNRMIIAGLDVGQRLSGTSLKLLAYERLLQDYPSWQSRVVMVQRVLVPGSRKADEESTTRELRCLVKRIQDRFGPAVIDYEEIHGSSRLPMDQRLALWKSSAVFMITPIREGLNQWPMEYIYTRKDGVVIASEFSAISSILNGALRVNPFDIQMTITVIDKALSMNKAEREGRRYRDIDFVSNSPSDKWVRNVLRDLKDATRKQSSTSSRSSSLGGSGNNSSTATPLGGMTPTMSRTTSESILQGTAGFLLKESDEAFIRLNMQHLHQAYRVTTQRVIILDFNGTIVLKEPPGKYLKREILGTSGNKPPPHVLDSLALLCADKRNTVYVVSGDSSENVLNALGHIKGLGLAVSNGAKFAEPVTDEKPTRKWQSFDLGVDWAAVKRVALPVLSKYTARSNGSFVKLTAFSIGWSYYSCDPEWGSLQASHLVLELESELRQFDVRFVTLKGVVEIVPRRLNKGLIVKKVLRDVSIRNPPENNVDFIMCLGDDISDEKMFTSVLSFVAEVGHEDHAAPGPPVVNEDGTLVVEGDFNVDGQRRTNKIRDPMFCYTVAVGKKPSHASMYVNDAQEVAKALVLLASGSYPVKGDESMWGSGGSSSLFM